MTSHDDFDRSFSAWLTDVAPMREPDALLGQVLARTARTRRRPAWRIPERWIPVSTISTRFASTSPVPLRAIGVVALLILALAVGLALIAGSTQRQLPPPFGVADNGGLVYSDGDDILIRSTVDGVSRTLIGGDAVDVGPTLSGDGTQLAFLRVVSDAAIDLWVADTDGTDARRIGGPFEAPDWLDFAPAGDRVAVQSVVGGVGTVTLVPTDGGSATVLDLGMPATFPTFRPPLGDQLSFVGRDEAGRLGIYLMDLTGGEPVKLELDTTTQDAFPDAGYFDDPAWSPDGTRLAFVSYSPSTSSSEGRSLRIHIAEVGPTGAVVDEATLRDDRLSVSEFNPTWLPTGDAIVYKRNLPGDRLELVSSVVTPEVSAAKTLGLAASETPLMVVSPDGTTVASIVDEAREVWITSLADASSIRQPGWTVDDLLGWQRLAAGR